MVVQHGSWLYSMVAATSRVARRTIAIPPRRQILRGTASWWRRLTVSLYTQLPSSQCTLVSLLCHEKQFDFLDRRSPDFQQSLTVPTAVSGGFLAWLTCDSATKLPQLSNPFFLIALLAVHVSSCCCFHPPKVWVHSYRLCISRRTAPYFSAF